MKIQEKPVRAMSGWVIVVGVVVILVVGVLWSWWAFGQGSRDGDLADVLPAAAGFVVSVVLLVGLFMLQPNEAAVLTLFGKYRGTVSQPGLQWANPLYAKRKVSLRIRNFNGDKIKVNDSRGNPVEIACIVVWRVHDTAQAVFQVDDYQHYVTIQSEAALRHLAMAYPYDVFDGDVLTLRGSTDEVSAALQEEVQERVLPAGVQIEEARLSHLAYAPEIAEAMLQRQQADAIVEARTRIVEGAVGMVEMAVHRIDETDNLELDGERRAAMISNLLVVLCGHEAARPVINTGTLYT